MHLLYLTAWVDAYGAMQFRQDIYGEDAELLAMIEQVDNEPVVDLPVLIGEIVPETRATFELALAD